MKYSFLLLLFSLMLSPMKGQTKDEFKAVNKMLEQISKGSKNLHLSTLDSWTPEMKEIGDRNRHRVDSIYALYGWLKPPLISKTASRAYFDVLQYSPTERQEKLQNEAFLAAQSNVIKSGEYYAFIDRLRTSKNLYQIFGTQGKTDEAGNLYFIPIDTTLVHNRKLPILPPGEYIYFSNPKLMTLFIHVYMDIQSIGVEKAQVYIDGIKVGETNKSGFFQTTVSKRKKQIDVTIRKGSRNRVEFISLEENIDWLDSFINL